MMFRKKKKACETEDDGRKELLARIDAHLIIFIQLQKEGLQKMSELDVKIAQLKTDVAALASAEQQAVAVLKSVPSLIAAAVATALAAGATTDQLQSLTDVATAVESATADLTANAPAPAPAPSAAAV